MIKQLKSLVVGATVLFGTTLSLEATTAWEINNPASFSNASWAFGDLFTVGNSDITVNGLGAIDINLDGFVTVGGIPVGLYNSVGTLLASTFVQSSDTLIGNYRFSDIQAVTLNAGQQYRVVAVSGSDLYNVATSTPDNVDSSITWNGYEYGASNSLAILNSFSGAERSWMANFRIGGAQQVPDSGATVALLGLGLLGLSLARRRLCK